MHSPVRWVQLRDSVRTAARIMRDENVGFVIVCNASGGVVGTVTDRDIALRLVADDHVPGATVESVMTEGPICCMPEDDVGVAERLMRQHHKSRIVCADGGGHALGVISLADIARVESPGRAGRLLRDITSRESRESRESRR